MVLLYIGLESFTVSAELRIGRGLWAAKERQPSGSADSPPSPQGIYPVLRLFPNPDAQTLAQVLRAHLISGFWVFKQADFCFRARIFACCRSGAHCAMMPLDYVL